MPVVANIPEEAVAVTKVREANFGKIPEEAEVTKVENPILVKIPEDASVTKVREANIPGEVTGWQGLPSSEVIR